MPMHIIAKKNTITTAKIHKLTCFRILVMWLLPSSLINTVYSVTARNGKECFTNRNTESSRIKPQPPQKFIFYLPRNYVFSSLPFAFINCLMYKQNKICLTNNTKHNLKKNHIFIYPPTSTEQLNKE
jgi:hypothetical protein